MDAKTIIKEIDPDYQRCEWCERLLHKSELKKMIGGHIVCANVKDCADNISIQTIQEKVINNIPFKGSIREGCLNIDYIGKLVPPKRG